MLEGIIQPFHLLLLIVAVAVAIILVVRHYDKKRAAAKLRGPGDVGKDR